MTYTFNTEPNNYFNGQDVRVSNGTDDILVNFKDGMWAVNVKADVTRAELKPVTQLAMANLTDATVEAIERRAKEAWWMNAQEIGVAHDFPNVYSAGRSSGWAALHRTEDWPPADLFNTGDPHTRRFLACAFALVESIETGVEDFEDGLAEANAELQVELSEYAGWVGAEVQPLDGGAYLVEQLAVRDGRAILVFDGHTGIAFATESKLVRKADGNVPSRLTADPIMEQVFQIIEARGELTNDEIDTFLDADDDNDPTALYEEHIAPGVNAIEDEIKTHHEREGGD